MSRKHVDTNIKAFAEVYKDDKKAALDIIGGGQEKEELEKLTVSSGVSDKCHFRGTLSRQDVMQKMYDSHIFTMISSKETFGMVYIEAMLQGCIVVASKDGGFDGIIKNGANGFLCREGDEKELAGIYQHIMALSSKERNMIGQNAIDTALNFSERAVAERYLQNVVDRNES